MTFDDAQLSDIALGFQNAINVAFRDEIIIFDTFISPKKINGIYLLATGQLHFKIKFYRYRCIDISEIFINTECRRTGIARRVVQTLFNEARRVGISKILISATRDAAFVWARLGFKPTPEAWPAIYEVLQTAIIASREHMNDEQYQLLSRLIEHNNPVLYPLIAQNQLLTNRTYLQPVGIGEMIINRIGAWNGELITNAD
ncbi:GNAT family N-acetyltransferase [Brucella inopinata]|uniref:GNAT family N-acetyltransferase n=1 Tax=Brucella inopinata TaxID=1218315 RepID=A0AAW7BID1_9HYPH|nr:GNAT family N-acetyltransferase [Brucella inopinata]KEY04612.1 hypothetical protein IL59_0209455 [Brucella suis bv. 4 str. 40]MDL2334163.1 GNAT family N-acetyltransferase [Brucella inopinata]